MTHRTSTLALLAGALLAAPAAAQQQDGQGERQDGWFSAERQPTQHDLDEDLRWLETHRADDPRGIDAQRSQRWTEGMSYRSEIYGHPATPAHRSGLSGLDRDAYDRQFYGDRYEFGVDPRTRGFGDRSDTITRRGTLQQRRPGEQRMRATRRGQRLGGDTPRRAIGTTPGGSIGAAPGGTIGVRPGGTLGSGATTGARAGLGPRGTDATVRQRVGQRMYTSDWYDPNGRFDTWYDSDF